MSTITRFEELRVWQKARELSQTIFNLYQEEPSPKTLPLEIKSTGPLGQLWTT